MRPYGLAWRMVAAHAWATDKAGVALVAMWLALAVSHAVRGDWALMVADALVALLTVTVMAAETVIDRLAAENRELRAALRRSP